MSSPYKGANDRARLRDQLDVMGLPLSGSPDDVRKQKLDQVNQRELTRLNLENAARLQRQQWQQDHDAEQNRRLTRLNLERARREERLADLQEEQLHKSAIATENTLEAQEHAKAIRAIEDEIRKLQLTSSRYRLEQEKAPFRDPEDFIADGDAYPWEPGMLYLGRCRNSNAEVGAFTDVHALTVGASGFGKGASTIVQNLKRWPHNAIVIDAKDGENAALTAQHRAEKFNQEVFLLDPFDCVDMRDIKNPLVRKVQLNPLDGIDLDADDASDRLATLAHGLIIRDNAHDEYWQRGSENILQGLIAGLVELQQRNATLGYIRDTFAAMAARDDGPDNAQKENKPAVDLDRVQKMIAVLRECENDFTMKAITEMDSRQGESHLSGIISSTQWLDKAPLRRWLEKTTPGFSLDAVKRRDCSLYIILPSKQVPKAPVFLRLLVSLLLEDILEFQGGKKTLFILDEFAALGFLKPIKEKFGVLRSYNCTAWLMLQNWSQMEANYGDNTANAIRGDCRIAEFFSPDDPKTREMVSRDVGINPLTNQPILHPNQYAELVSKDGPLAARKIVFMPGRPRVISIRPQGHWNDDNLLEKKPSSLPQIPQKTAAQIKDEEERAAQNRAHQEWIAYQNSYSPLWEGKKHEDEKNSSYEFRNDIIDGRFFGDYYEFGPLNEHNEILGTVWVNLRESYPEWVQLKGSPDTERGYRDKIWVCKIRSELHRSFSAIQKINPHADEASFIISCFLMYPYWVNKKNKNGDFIKLPIDRDYWLRSTPVYKILSRIFRLTPADQLINPLSRHHEKKKKRHLLHYFISYKNSWDWWRRPQSGPAEKPKPSFTMLNKNAIGPKPKAPAKKPAQLTPPHIDESLAESKDSLASRKPGQAYTMKSAYAHSQSAKQ